MGNRLFQEARHFVELAQNVDSFQRDEAVSRAQNALSSAYANCTRAEQAQLSELQEQLDELLK